MYSAHHPLCPSHLYISNSRVNVADAAYGKGEPSDRVCEIAEAPVISKSDVSSYREKGEEKKRQHADSAGL